MPSSVISVMIYHPASQVLQIVFRATGETYAYHEVPFEEWQRFLAAPSKGTYLNQTFKDKGFRFHHFSRGKAPRMPHGSLRWPPPESLLAV